MPNKNVKREMFKYKKLARIKYPNGYFTRRSSLLVISNYRTTLFFSLFIRRQTTYTLSSIFYCLNYSVEHIMDKLLNLTSFNLKKACSTNFNALLIGKRNTGKSTLVNDVLYFTNLNKTPRVCVFSGTEEANGNYAQFIPSTFIYNDNNVEQNLQNILDQQKILTKKKILGRLPKNCDIRITLILDDIGYKRGTLRSEVVRQIAMNGRHYGISMVVACQYVCDCPVDVRTNTDYVFVLKQNGCIINLYKNFFSGFDKKKDFKTVLDACSNNYECLVLDNTKPTTNIAEVCFFYKAKLGRKFRFGSKDLWTYHNRWGMSDNERFLRNEKLQKKMKQSKQIDDKSVSEKRLSNGLIVNKKKNKK